MIDLGQRATSRESHPFVSDIIGNPLRERRETLKTGYGGIRLSCVSVSCSLTQLQ